MVAKSHVVLFLLPMNVQSLIRLQLDDVEIAQHQLVEALGRCCGPLEPSRDGVAGMARDAGGRRNAHALDAQARDLVEFASRAAKTPVRRPGVRAERAPADCAAVAPPSARFRHRPAVAHDVEARLSRVVTPGVAARYLVDLVHRSSVPGRPNPSFRPRSHDQQRPAQAPTNAEPGSRRMLKVDRDYAIHSANFDHRRVSTFPLTAIPTACFWPTKTTSFLPLVMPV